MSRLSSDNETSAPRRRLSPLQLFLMAVLAVGAGLILWQSCNAPYRVAEGEAFGTTFRVKYKWAEPLDNDIVACLEAVDGSMSMFNDSSVVSRVNRGETDQVDDLFAEVFALSAKVSEQTGGYFDVTVKPLVDAWGFGTKERRQPQPSDIDSLLQITGYRKISLSGHSIIKNDKRTTIDFSAVAKGYACDFVARRLRNLGVTDFMVEIGGEIACHGSGENHGGWLIGISKPTDDSLGAQHGLQEKLMISNRCVATSGNYHRFYYSGGRKVAHTINPHTGMPVAHSLLSATVVASQTARADAFATAFMAAGLDSSVQILGRNPSVDAYLIYADSLGTLRTWHTEGFGKYLYKE